MKLPDFKFGCRVERINHPSRKCGDIIPVGYIDKVVGVIRPGQTPPWSKKKTKSTWLLLENKKHMGYIFAKNFKIVDYSCLQLPSNGKTWFV